MVRSAGCWAHNGLKNRRIGLETRAAGKKATGTNQCLQPVGHFRPRRKEFVVLEAVELQGAQPADRAAGGWPSCCRSAPTMLLPPVPSLAPRGCSQPTPARGRGIHSGWFKQVRKFGPSRAWGHPWGLAKTSLELIHSSHSSQGSRAHSSDLPLSLPGVRATRRSEGAPPEPSSPCPRTHPRRLPPLFWHVSAAPFSASTSENPNQPEEELGKLREMKQTGDVGL